MCIDQKLCLYRNFVWDLALSKLYTNALMSTLNARAGFGRMMGNGNGVPTNVLFTNESFNRDGSKQRGVSVIQICACLVLMLSTDFAFFKSLML